MASEIIKGLTVQIGGDTTALGKALEAVNKKSKALSGELSEINRMLKFDPSSAELLKQKQKALAESIQNTSDKLKVLKDAEAQVQEQFRNGDASEAQVRALRREVIQIERKLKREEAQAEETEEALSALGKGAEEAGKKTEKFGGAAEDAEKKTSHLGDSLSKKSAIGFKSVIAAAAAAGAAVIGCAAASEDYRREMGKLNTAFTANKLSSAAAKKTYQELQSVLGDTEQAVEAAGHLAALAENEAELATWTDICTGVYAKFGSSLPMQNLTEAANETAKTGKITGALADALNWAGASEENFQKSLEGASSEQERQALITSTLSALYRSAAAQYRVTNATVIEANRATEEWNASLAKVGETVAPLLTEIKRMGASILAEAVENLPIISTALIGATASLVAAKVAAISYTAVQKGLTIATLKAAAAQKALSLAQAATPWGLVALAAGGVATVVASLAASNKKAAEEADVLTEAERELMQSANEAAEAMRAQRKATQETVNGIMSQMLHVDGLADELFRLADASGKVGENDRSRAEFILNELNAALGTEYKLTGNVIERYDELKDSINEVTQAKTANLLLDARSGDYEKATREATTKFQNKELAKKEVEERKKIVAREEEKLQELKDAYSAKSKVTWTSSGSAILANDRLLISEQELKLKKKKEELEKADKAFQEASADYMSNFDLIRNFEEATELILTKNYDSAIALMKGSVEAVDGFAPGLDEKTANELFRLKKDMEDAKLDLRRMEENYEAGIGHYSDAEFEQAKKRIQELTDAYNAYDAAYAAGKDIGNGMAEGMNDCIPALDNQAKENVDAVISAARDEAECHSPSRKMAAFGRDLIDGVILGVKEREDALLSAVSRLITALTGTQRPDSDAAQMALRNLQAAALARQTDMPTVGDSTLSKLDAILAAIKAGQVLTIDGGQLVGATASRYDTAFGQRRALAARGAV